MIRRYNYMRQAVLRLKVSSSEIDGSGWTVLRYCDDGQVCPWNEIAYEIRGLCLVARIYGSDVTIDSFIHNIGWKGCIINTS